MRNIAHTQSWQDAEEVINAANLSPVAHLLDADTPGGYVDTVMYDSVPDGPDDIVSEQAAT